MNDLIDSYTKLLGREPTDEEIQQLYRVKDALGLKNNDSLWLIIMALEHYNNYYKKFPSLIGDETSRYLKEFRSAAVAISNSAMEETRANLIKAVHESSVMVAHHVAGRDKTRWIIGSLVAASLILSGWAYAMYQMGYREGSGESKAAVAWANTPQGRRAYELSNVTDIDALARCTLPGWRIEKGNCYPGPAKDKATYGFKIP
jgi:hypothetical protein